MRALVHFVMYANAILKCNVLKATLLFNVYYNTQYPKSRPSIILYDVVFLERNSTKRGQEHLVYGSYSFEWISTKIVDKSKKMMFAECCSWDVASSNFAISRKYRNVTIA